MINDISGFMVVRLPKLNTASIASTQNKIVIPKQGHSYYCGLDRMSWKDLDDAYYDNQLPSDLIKIWGKKDFIRSIVADMELLSDIDDARKVLSFCNRDELQNEIIAVNVPCVEREPIKSSYALNMTWLGYDIFSIGEFSLLLSGIYKYPNAFNNIKLNEYGLLDNSEAAQLYIAEYFNKVKRGICENIGGPVEIIRVARVY